MSLDDFLFGLWVGLCLGLLLAAVCLAFGIHALAKLLMRWVLDLM